MVLFAGDILDQYESTCAPPPDTSNIEDGRLVVDIGVTKKPYFHDKAISIEQCGLYENAETSQQPQQVHLLGFDSLVRLLDTKYYPPTHRLDPLSALFDKHRIRVTRRTEEGDKYGSVEEQDRVWVALADGERDKEGGKREWAMRIDMVEGEGESVSSTRVREAVGIGDWAVVEKLVGKEIRVWVEREGLYTGHGG